MHQKIGVVLALLLLPAAAQGGYRYDRVHNVLYIENGASATLSALKAALPNAPLQRVDPANKIWHLGASIVIANGGALRLHGSRAGGDVDELRLRSDNDGRDRFVAITADHGFLDVRATRITSWDAVTGGPDLEHETYGRAFIRARSRLRSMVLIPLQSRFDISDSEIGWLGYGANESYGLVWKVVAPQPYVLSHVRVFGNVLRSDIHHNYFGLYSSGARGSEWRGNEVHHNVQYGMAPHTHSDGLVIEDNDVHDNGHYGITVRQNSVKAVVHNNRVWKNGTGGINIHRDSNDATITGNRVYENQESGIMVYASARAVVRDNAVLRNGHVGVQLAMGTSGSHVEQNEVGDNGFYGIFVGKGKGRPDPGGGLPRGNVIARNVIYGSAGEDLRTGDAALNEFTHNSLRVAPDPQRAARDNRSLFFNPPRPDYAALETPRAATLPAAAVGTAPAARNRRTRTPDEGLRLWPFPDPVLWVGAIALIVALLMRYGYFGRRDRDP